MTWDRDLGSSVTWRCGRYKIVSRNREYVLSHPDMPKALKYPNPDMAKNVAFYLAKGGMKP